MAIGLSQGQLADTAAAIYTAASSVQVKTILLFNSGSSSAEASLYCVASGGSATNDKEILRVSLSSGESFEFSPSYPITLSSSGDSIHGKGASADTVNYIVMGV